MMRANGVAVWTRLAALLRDDIATTPLRPGERPVSEAELAKRFEVNRHTVGRTLDELAHERLIRIKHGRGSQGNRT